MTLPYSSITPIADNAPAVPATWNTRLAEADENFADLEARAVAAAASLGLLDERVTVIEGDSSAAVSSAVKLDWLYRNFRMVAEMWAPHWTLLDPIALAVTGAVGGDDSVDVSSTADLIVGNEYVLYDGSHQESVVVDSILSATRFRTVSDLTYTYTAAVLKRSNFTLSGGLVRAAAGQVYYCGPVNLGNDDIDKALVIRRQDNDTALRLYFQDATHSSWTEAPWEWRRIIEDGVVDVEYRLAARGDIKLKLVAEAGATTTQAIVYHFVGVYTATGLRGTHRPPETPANSLPADNAIDVQETPTLSVASYAHPAGTALNGLQVQLAAAVDGFDAPLFDSGLRLGGLSFAVDAGLLAVSTEYFWRARVRDAEGAWSAWSTPTSFTTAASFAYIVTPVNTAPVNGAEDVIETPTLTASAFAMYGGSDTHAKSQWQVRSLSGSYASPVHDSGESDDLVSHDVPAGKLMDNEAVYYFRVRYKGAVEGWSEWSTETSFSTLALFTRIFGLAQVASGGGAGTWQHVDADGDNFTPGATYFTTHPVYAGIVDVLHEGQHMVKIPKFYYKVGNAPEGSDQDGKKCWWISSAPTDGFALHPAFKKNGATVDYFLVSKYEASGNSSLLASVAGAVPFASSSVPTLLAAIEARNEQPGSFGGWHAWTVYELAAIQMLCLLELGTPDVQSEIALGNVTGGVESNTGSTAAVWRGICELWGNQKTFVDGIKITTQPYGSNPLQLFDLNGNRTYVACPLAAALSGWVTAMRADSGATYKFDAIFFPSAVDADQVDGTFADQVNVQRSDTYESYAVAEGGSSSGSAAGLFLLYFYTTGGYGNVLSSGARLACH